MVKFVIFLCCVISQGNAVALDRWGGKWNHLSMMHWCIDWLLTLPNITVIGHFLQVILQNVVTCFVAWNINKQAQSLSEYECENSKVLCPRLLWWAYNAPSDPLAGLEILLLKEGKRGREGKGEGCVMAVRLAPTHYLNSTAVSEWVALTLGHPLRQQCYI